MIAPGEARADHPETRGIYELRPTAYIAAVVKTRLLGQPSTKAFTKAQPLFLQEHHDSLSPQD